MRFDWTTYRAKIAFFIGVAIVIFALDQAIKLAILEYVKSHNPSLETPFSLWKSEFIDIVLVYNRGVAFSFLSFLGDWLKWLLLGLIIVVIAIIIRNRDFLCQYFIPLGAIVGAGLGNLLDRFIREGVVDYIYWHYGFKFAVFNFADSMINISIAFIIIWEITKILKERKNA